MIFLFQIKRINAKYLNSDFCSNTNSCANYKFINKPNNFDKINEFYSSNNKTALCEACDVALPLIRKLIFQNKTEHFQSILTFICKEFKLASPIVCEFFVKEKEVF